MDAPGEPEAEPAQLPVAASFQGNDSLLAALLDSSAEAILAVDTGGRIILANRRTEEIFGYSREELWGASIEILLPEARRAAHQTAREEYFEHPRTRPMGIGMELSGRHKNGTEFPVEVSLSSIRNENGVVAIAFVSEISLRKTLEEQLMHAQKMEAVGRLAGGLAHDFNNMLTVISGYNRMMLDELGPDHALRSYVEEIQLAADRAAELSNQLLVFSRRQVVRASVLDVNTVLSNLEKMLRRLIGEDIQLVLNLRPDVGDIRADPNQIEQAIVNLVVNARDAMPGGGRITIETANLALDNTYVRSHLGVQPGDFVMIAVTDTGHGFDAETKRHMFEPFFTTKPKGKGTGLGLSTVYGMVKQNRGDIWAYSEPGQGATFKLYFPRVSEAKLAVSQSSGESAKALGSETILVVEDEDSVRDLTTKILRHLGYTVLSAASGPEALEVASRFEGEIALLLTDVVMPGMSGRQLADALRLLRPELRVLYVSGYTETTIMDRGVIEAELDFLAKPFNRDMLAKKIGGMLRGRQAQREG